MKKISITNKFGKSFGAEMLDPTEWINEQVAKNSWGKPQRWVHENDCTPEDIAEALQSRIVGEIPDQYTEYELPAEYTIEITDVTAEYAAKEADRIDRENASTWLKTNKGNIMSVPELNEAVLNIIKHLGL